MEKPMMGHGRRIGGGRFSRRDCANVKGTSLAGSKLFGAMLLLAVAALGVSCSRSNVRAEGPAALPPGPRLARCFGCTKRDRKSTRLNSSHLGISYAVFCLKK